MKKESNQIQVIGVVRTHDSYFIHLADDSRIQVDIKEYQKMKKRLSGKSEQYIEIRGEKV